MKRNNYIWKIFLLLLISSPGSLLAQEDSSKWTLEKCINYAIEHNIQIQQQKINKENKEVELSTSKNSWLPNLNGGVGQNFDFGRSPSKTGVIVDQNSANTSAYLQLNMPLYDGKKIINTISANKLDLKASMAALEKAKEDLSINVASYFIQVLYNKEILNVSILQKELTEQQVDKTQKLVDVGKVPLSQLYDIKAQLSRDNASFVEADNNYKLAILNLAQLLDIEHSVDGFLVQAPAIDDAIEKYMGSILPPDVLYSRAVEVKPAIQEQLLLLESSKKRLKIAKAAYLPQLSFNASYSNGYYHYYNTEVENIGLSDQLKQNVRKTLGFSLSIPIFNRFQTRNTVRQARLGIRNQKLQVENSKKELYKEIQQAYFNATAAQEKYRSSKLSVEASKKAFDYAKERYELGKSNVFEFNESKTKYAQSLAEQAQAKYNYVFRTKILDFYNGKPLKL